METRAYWLVLGVEATSYFLLGSVPLSALPRSTITSIPVEKSSWVTNSAGATGYMIKVQIDARAHPLHIPASSQPTGTKEIYFVISDILKEIFTLKTCITVAFRRHLSPRTLNSQNKQG